MTISSTSEILGLSVDFMSLVHARGLKNARPVPVSWRLDFKVLHQIKFLIQYEKLPEVRRDQKVFLLLSCIEPDDFANPVAAISMSTVQRVRHREPKRWFNSTIPISTFLPRSLLSSPSDLVCPTQHHNFPSLFVDVFSSPTLKLNVLPRRNALLLLINVKESVSVPEIGQSVHVITRVT